MKKFLIFLVIVILFVFGAASFAVEKTQEGLGPVLVVEKAGEVICELDGTTFVKVNDGKAIVGLHYNRNGALVPVLVSEDPEAVRYMVSSTGQEIPNDSSIKIEHKNKDYYTNWNDGIAVYTQDRQSNQNLPILFLSGVDSAYGAAEDLLKSYDQQEAGGPWMYFLKYQLIWFILVPLGIYICLRFFGSKDTDDFPHIGGGSGSGGWKDVIVLPRIDVSDM